MNELKLNFNDLFSDSFEDMRGEGGEGRGGRGGRGWRRREGVRGEYCEGSAASEDGVMDRTVHAKRGRAVCSGVIHAEVGD